MTDNGVWPRWYYRLWEDLIGPEYAAKLTRSYGLYLGAILLLGVGLLTSIFIMDNGHFGAGLPFIICAGVIGLVGMFNFVRVWSLVSRDMRARGIPVKSMPNFLHLYQFQSWCTRENMTPEQVKETGRLTYGTPTGAVQ